MEDIKRFTLKWWFALYRHARLMEDIAFDNDELQKEINYCILADWIQRRIINKYGE